MRASRVVALVLVCSACSHPQPPVSPGEPIAADPPVQLRTMVEECDALLGALGTWKACPNLDWDERDDIDAYVERAQKDFASGRKANPEPNAQRVVALACYRATRSVAAATERCQAGPTPPDAWYPRRRR